MNFNSKAPKGITKTEWRKVRTIGYFVNNGVILEDAGMTSYTDAPSYPKDKSKAAKEFVKFYHDRYPEIFGRGKAGPKFEQFLAKQTGRVAAKAQIQKYQEDGLIGELGFKYQDGASKQDDILAQLNLSGGIFDALTSKQQKSGKKDKALQSSLYPLALKQGDNNFGTFEAMLPVDYSDVETSRVQYQKLGDLIADNAGPSRVLLSGYFSELEFGIDGALRECGTYQGKVMPMRVKRRIVDLINKAAGLAATLETKISGFNAQKFEIAAAPAGWTVAPAGTSATGKQFASKEATGAEIAVLNPDFSSNVDNLTAAVTKIYVFVKGKAGDERLTKFVDEGKQGLIKDEQSALLDIRESVINKTLYSRRQLAQSLQDAMIEARVALRDGGLDARQYKAIEKQLKAIQNQANKIPTLGALSDALQDGDYAKVRDAKNMSVLINKSIENVKTQIGKAATIQAAVQSFKDQGTSAEIVVKNLEKAFDQVKYVSMIPSTSTYTIGATTYTIAEINEAKSAAKTLGNALIEARKSGTERALNIFAQLTNATAEMKEKLARAKALSADWQSKKMSTVVDAQRSGMALISDPKHIANQISAFYMTSETPYLAKTFLTIGDQMLFAANSVRNELGNLIGSASIPQIEDMIDDPNKVMDALPSRCRAMDADQAAARAYAVTQYLKELTANFATTAQQFQAAQTSFSMGGDAKATYKRRFDMMKKKLQESKYESGCKNTELPNHNAGLHYVGFTPKYDYAANENPMTKATVAITCPDDLLRYPIFRGDTFISTDNTAASNALRQARYPGRGYGARQQALKQDDASIGTDPKNYLARRPVENSFGEMQYIDWSPMKAKELRDKFFVSLYPFDMRIPQINKAYNDKLRELRGQSAIAAVTTDVDSLFN